MRSSSASTPSFNRTAAKADLCVQFRSGTDIAVLGGLMNYAMTHGRYFHGSTWSSTPTPSFLVHPDFRFEDGLFSGARWARTAR